MTSSATVVVVGAGVTGLSTAYHLASKRFGRTILIDKGPVGDGSSERAAAIITNHLWTETGIQVRKRCLQLYSELSNSLSEYQFHQVGCLNLFDSASWSDRKPLLPLYEKLSVPAEVMNAADLVKRWPVLRPREDAVGLFDPLGGYSEPYEYISALKKCVGELGVEIREYEPVTGFDCRGNGVTGVRTRTGIIEADAVVSTVYSWTRVLLETVGLTLPMKCFVHQRYVTEALPEPIEIPAVNANPYMAYFRPTVHGAILAGLETSGREEYVVESLDFHLSELSISPDLKNQLRTSLETLLPVLKTVGWASEKYGLLTFSMDGEPILGPIRQIPGLFVGLAFHSGGFAYNPGTGELLAEYIMRGKTRIDVSTWSPDRFDAEETKQYLATRISQKDVARRRH